MEQMLSPKSVLSFRELPVRYSRTRQHLKSIQDFVADSPHEFEEPLFRYLFHGLLAEPVGGGEINRDILDRSRTIGEIRLPGVQTGYYLNAGHLLTDGVWYWYGFHLYYLREYHLRLNEEFIAHAQCQNWIPTADRSLLYRIDPDKFLPEMAEGL